MKRFEEAKKRSIRFVSSALNRSLLGWMQWVDNPEVMTRFTKEDLKEMNKKLSEFTRSFMRARRLSRKIWKTSGRRATLRL